MWALSSHGEQNLPFTVARRLSIAVATVVEHRLWARGLQQLQLTGLVRWQLLESSWTRD